MPRTSVRRALPALLVLAVLLTAARVSLPHAIKHRIESRSEARGAFLWKIRDVDVHLLNASYDLVGATLTRKAAPGSEPLLEAERITSALLWRPFSGERPAMRLIAEHPRWNIESGAGKAGPKKGAPDWRRILGRLALFRLSGFDIHRGEIRFTDREADPPVVLFASGVEVTAGNLYRAGPDSARRARLDARGRFMDAGDFRLTLRLHPEAADPEFDLGFSLRDMRLRSMSRALEAYAGMEVSQGRLDLSAQVTARGGGYRGRIRTALRDFESAETGKEDWGFLEGLAEKAAGLAGEILEWKSEKNREEGKPPPEAGFSGRFPENVRDVWSMSEYLLKESFRQGVKPVPGPG